MKPYGPTKATMERLLAARPAPEPVTDWFRADTYHPVQPGYYDVGFDRGCGTIEVSEMRRYWNGVMWLNNGPHGDRSNLLRGFDTSVFWRGIRRWVLVRKAQPDRATQGGQLADVYLVSARPRAAKLSRLLVEARHFKSEAAAQRFAARYPRLGLTAVLP